MIIKKKKIRTDGAEVQTDKEPSLPEQEQGELQEQVEPKEEEIDLFDLDNIDFKQRQERRRGDRRRGFRRIDDRNLISRAREEADAIRESAAKEGYQEGLEAAKEDLQEIKDALNVFFTAKQDVYDSIAPDVLEISFDIAKKIIKKEVSENPEIILDNIREILKGLSKEEAKIMLKVNPSQAAMLKQRVPEEVSNVGLDAKVIIMPDENTMEGGCLVTTTNGVIDATIETQLDIITKVLKEL